MSGLPLAATRHSLQREWTPYRLSPAAWWDIPTAVATTTLNSVSNSFEGGTSGTAISVAGSGGTSGDAFTAVTVSNGASLTYDNAKSAHGSLAAKVVTDGTAGETAYCELRLPAPTLTVAARCYAYLPAATANQAQSIAIKTNGASQILRLRLTGGTGAKNIQIDDSAYATTSASISCPLDQWIRIEVQATISPSGQATLSVYSPADSTTPTATTTITGLNFGSTGAQRIRFGLASAITLAETYWLDDLAANDSGDLIGPVGSSSPWTNGSIVTPLDRIAGMPLVEVSGRSAPVLQAAGIGGKPSLYFDRTALLQSPANSLNVNCPFTVLAVLDGDPGEPQFLTTQEQGFESSGVGRFATNGGATNATLTRDTTYSSSGLASMKIAAGTGTGTADSNGAAISAYSNTAPLRAGHTYQASGKCFVPSGQPAPNLGPLIRPWGWNTTTSTVHRFTTSSSYNMSQTGTWQSLTTTFTVSADSNQSWVEFHGGYDAANPTCAVWWDELSIVDTTANTPYVNVTPLSLIGSGGEAAWTAASSVWWINGLYGAVISNGVWNGTLDTLDYSPTTFLVDAGTPHVVELACDGTAAGVGLYEDGAAVTLTPYATSGSAYQQDPGTATVTGRLYLGALSGQFQAPFKGRVAEIVVVPRVLTATERASWHRYVQNKYAITTADPA